MARLVWTPRAIQDVARLHAFLLPKNPDAAKRAVAAIRHGVGALEANPRIGRPAQGRSPEFRERVIPFGSGAYVALYRYANDAVIILAVRHAREAGY